MKTQQQEIELSAVFTKIKTSAGALERVANGILSAIKTQDAKTLEHFNEMVADAYVDNGWSTKAGRPAKGTKEKPAPDAVQLYVSTVRAAYRMSLDVMSFETMGALRVAIRDKRSTPSQDAARPPELVGVQLSSDDRLTGALIHDTGTLWKRLRPKDQKAMTLALQKVLDEFMKLAPPELKMVA